MFDQNDQNQPTTDAQATAPVADPAAAAPVNPMPPAADPALATAPPVEPAPSAPVPEPAVAEPVQTDAPAFNTTTLPPADDPIAAPALDPVVQPSSDTGSLGTPPVANDGLLALKQQALHNLSPLLSQLDQAPEEKFRTTMMMIQASDDQSLIQAAYDAANAITDEKAKAQALLDVVNEINYFTQAKPSTPPNPAS